MEILKNKTFDLKDRTGKIICKIKQMQFKELLNNVPIQVPDLDNLFAGIGWSIDSQKGLAIYGNDYIVTQIDGVTESATPLDITSLFVLGSNNPQKMRETEVNSSLYLLGSWVLGTPQKSSLYKIKFFKGRFNTPKSKTELGFSTILGVISQTSINEFYLAHDNNTIYPCSGINTSVDFNTPIYFFVIGI